MLETGGMPFCIPSRVPEPVNGTRRVHAHQRYTPVRHGSGSGPGEASGSRSAPNRIFSSASARAILESEPLDEAEAYAAAGATRFQTVEVSLLGASQESHSTLESGHS